ncbi:MAG: flavodoxin [Betaproteobacteria bacterium]
MKRLLIVYHTQFGGTGQMAAAALDGARSIDDVDSRLVRAGDAGVGDLLAADALLIATSENFGGMAGIVKDFLERVYYPCEGKLEGRPYTALVCAATDGIGAMREVDRVATGLSLNKVHPGLIYKSGVTAHAQAVPADALASCREIGATLAAGISAGIY